LTTLVLDASVAVKWSIPVADEALIAESVQLLKRYTDGEIDFVVPDIFWAEVGTVLWKGVRRGRWSRVIAEGTAADIGTRQFPTVSSLTLLPEALRIALAYDRSVYDSLYVALAVHSKTELVTADERLANALAAHLPVKWLGVM
jgi:predicted nucleic acid-binding protein